MSNSNHDKLGETFRWTLEAATNPAVAAADWLIRDIDEHYRSAAEMFGDPEVTLKNLKQAKDVFKTMRVVGETATDRRIGARLYVAAIASARVHHNSRISSQTDKAMVLGLNGLLDDDLIPKPLHELARHALVTLSDGQTEKQQEKILLEDDTEEYLGEW